MSESFMFEIWATTWEWDTGDYYSLDDRHRFICLACFREGLIRPVTSRTMLCRSHGSQFREWRKRKGMAHRQRGERNRPLEVKGEP